MSRSPWGSRFARFLSPARRRASVAAVACVLWLVAFAGAAAGGAFDGHVSLTLDDGVFQDAKGRTGEPTYLILDLVCRDGRWEEDVYGWAWNLNRADHFGRLRGVKVDGSRVVLDLHVEIDGDLWIPGGLATYRVEAAVQDGTVTGTHHGTFRGREMAGKVTGTVAPLPTPRPGHVLPEVGEHPRLLLRRSEIPALKKRAASDWGKPLIEHIRANEDEGLAMGLMFVLTGDQAYADRCRAIIEKEMKDQTGGPFNLGHEHGRRQQRVALTLDLAWHGIPERFRAKVAGYLWYYHSRLTLRPTTFSKKTNQAPGSNYMAFVVCGGMTTQMAIWDAPGGFPAAPVPPRMERLSPPAEVETDKGTPVVTLQPGKVIGTWLLAGPFVAYKDRESHLVLAEQVEAQPHYRHWGQDFLASLGGAAKARPTRGTAVTYRGRDHRFEPIETPDRIDVWAVQRGVPCSAGYYYAVLRVPQAGWYTVRLEGENATAKQANPYMGEVNEKLSREHLAFRADARLVLAGEAFHEGDAVRLEAGDYPAMLRATTRQYQVVLKPRLEATTEADAKAALASRRSRFEKENALWDEFAEHYWRRPMFGICRRRALRYDLYAQGSGGYKNEAGSYHNYTMGWTPLLNHTYAAYHGCPMPNNAMALPCWVMTGEGHAGHFAKGFAVVPDDLKPAVLWAWERRKQGKEGQRRDPLMTLLNHPPDMEPKNPMGVLPNPYLDRQQGWCAFRSAWTGDEVICADVHFKAFQPTGWNRACAGSFGIRGFGRTWAWRGDKRSGERHLEENVVLFPEAPAWINGPGRVVHFEGRPDGSGVISGTLDDALLGVKLGDDGKPLQARDYGGRLVRKNLRDLGLRHFRAFGVDYGGACGSPGLFVVVDRTEGGKRTYWQMLLPVGKEGEADARAGGRTFTVTQGDASLVGTVVAPAGAALRLVEPGTPVAAVDRRGNKTEKKLEHPALWIEARPDQGRKGGDDFFVLMTLQRGKAPEVNVDGKGLAARVRVGKRTVRFDGTKVVFE